MTRRNVGSDPTLLGAGSNPIADTVPGTLDDIPVRSSMGTFGHYHIADRIGLGGMGEILLARDEAIGRDVAIKRLRVEMPTEELLTRFLREARIQARLEHPAIVPVHEIGKDDTGLPFFTMKRISGRTLAQRLDDKPDSPQKLLRALVDVSSAIDFAHSRGVVHRDLKPANIIIGGFGEVYVLDWGLARVVDGEVEEPIGTGIESADGTTQVGALLGTPGYMAPEQIHDAAKAGPPTDVYALGSVLFEVLAGEPLHVRGAAVASTVEGVVGSPARRKPELAIAPELDELCVEALAKAPGDRPTARAFSDRLQRFLEGDRDVARRQELARSALDQARAALASGDDAMRPVAMRAAGRALAFDPDLRGAADLVTGLMLEPPKHLPPALEHELAASEIATQRRQSRVAAMSFVAIGFFLLALSTAGVRSWTVWGLLAAHTAVMATASSRMVKRVPARGEMMLLAAGNALLASLLSRLFGSLIIVPSVTCIMALSLTAYPQLIDRARWVIAMLVASWLVPVVLEQIGWLEPTWSVKDHVIHAVSAVATIDDTRTTVLLIVGNCITILVIGLFANALATARRDAQRTVEVQAWHLKQLLPEEPEASSSLTTSSSSR